MAQVNVTTLSARLEDVRVLVVEDEFYIADDLRRCLTDAGATVIGPEPTLQRALDAVDAGGFDCAVLDLNLHGASAAPIADRLADLGIPFAIATGYGSAAVPERFNHTPRCEKPFDPARLVQLLSRLVAERAAPAG